MWQPVIFIINKGIFCVKYHSRLETSFVRIICEYNDYLYACVVDLCYTRTVFHLHILKNKKFNTSSIKIFLHCLWKKVRWTRSHFVSCCKLRSTLRQKTNVRPTPQEISYTNSKKTRSSPDSPTHMQESRYLSRCSDGLQSGRPGLDSRFLGPLKQTLEVETTFLRNVGELEAYYSTSRPQR